MKRRILALLLAVLLCVSLLSMSASAAGKIIRYTDVTTDDWYYDAVAYVGKNGLMLGIGDTFAPNDATTRAQIWTILARLDGKDYTTQTADWYAGARFWVMRHDISDGECPNAPVTREQLASMLYRYAKFQGYASASAADLSVFEDACDISAYAGDAMQWAVGAGLLNGMNGKLLPQGLATRAQVAAILERLHEAFEDTDVSSVPVAALGAVLGLLGSGSEEEDGWDGTVATREELLAAKSSWVYDKNETTGEETPGDLYTISSPELLAAYAQYVNEGNSKTTDKVVLTADMNLGYTDWTPIGTAEHPFRGRVFDGQNHTISNLRCNGGVDGHTDLEATCQGLFGYTWTNGNIIEIMNLTLHNVDIYAKNSAGALIGCLDTAQSNYYLAGYTGIHDISLTGKVTIEGGNSGGIAGSPVSHWALQTGFSRITIDADKGSYLSNVKARELSGDGVGGALGGVVAVAAWDRGSTNLTSNLNVTGVAGNVGGIVGVGNQVWYEINYTGDVTVKGVTPSESGKYNYGLAIGGFAPVWHHVDMSDARRATVVATGTLTLELTNGTTIHTNGQKSDAIGGFFW